VIPDTPEEPPAAALLFGDFELRLDSSKLLRSGAPDYCIRQIRRALDDSAEHPRFVETLPRVGYRFLAPVEVRHPETPAAPPAHSPEAARSQRSVLEDRRDVERLRMPDIRWE
jgi:hypothetical protein